MKLSTLGKPLIVFLLFISNPAYSQDCNVYFDFDRDQLRLNDVAKLDRIVNLYKSGEQKIKIVGYTDTSGTFKYNNELSARRANRVMEYLVSGGIERNNIFTESKGELYQYGADQLYSRRVEVSFRSAKDQFSSVSEFRKSLVPQTQTFIIPGDKDIEIEGAKGTIINIEANSFVGIEGKEVSGEVKLEL
ncbi:MAG TPA: OmpA family protein, partial [Saprospiraceae bacterium]|nr:OmpA family protein [Saprospiraceae bacterium]